MLILILISLVLDGSIWFFYLKFYRDLIGIVPISFAPAVLLLNIFLAAIIYRKQTLASFMLLGSGILIQVIYLVFLKFFSMSQAF